MNETTEIVVVGSSNTDMVVKSRRIPKPGETVVGGQFIMCPGGKGANQAVAAARLGARVRLLAKLGTDVFGHQALEGYRREGIDTELIIRDPRHHTGVALILVDEHGENSISVASGANNALTVDEVQRAAPSITRAGVLMLQLETPVPAVLRAAELASEAGVVVILDPAPAPDDPLGPELLRHVGVLTPNETEAQRLTGVEVHDEASARSAAARLLELGVDRVIITLGSQGALVAHADGSTLVPAVRVSAVDTTAAGDAFNGGLAVALARGDSLDEAVRWGAATAAVSVTRLGAQPSLPTTEQVQALLQSAE